MNPNSSAEECRGINDLYIHCVVVGLYLLRIFLPYSYLNQPTIQSSKLVTYKITHKSCIAPIKQ